MNAWPHARILELLQIDLPIIQAPMAGAHLAAMAIGVAQAGGLGSLPCALLTEAAVRREIAVFRARAARPLNLNFFCHAPPARDATREARWAEALESYYQEFGIAADAQAPAPARGAFDEAACALVEDCRPEVVSFHFGLPQASLVERVKAAGAKVVSTATSVKEAQWLEHRGADAIIAQGVEAGGHRGMFLTQDIATQLGTIALTPQVVDAVRVPVIAAGGIGDGRGIAAAFALGASAVQLGTAYLFCPEATLTPAHRDALLRAGEHDTALTNLFTGRPARGVVNRLMRELGPMSDLAPAFPLAGGALAPLRAHAEAARGGDFQPLWSGEAAALGRRLPAAELTAKLAEEARRCIRTLSS